MARTTVEKLRKLARKNPPKTDGMSEDELMAAINAITVQLSAAGVEVGERIALNEDRHIYRAALSKATS